MITAAEISAALWYDPKTGLFTWKWRPGMPRQWYVRYAGKVAGNVEPRGYIRIRIDGRCHYAHRLAWIVSGGGECKDVDHINGDKSDNRLCNLRSATRSQNLANSQKSNPKKGVHYSTKRGKYVAQIVCEGEHHWLGEFEHEHLAVAAYQQKAAQLFGEFACHLN